MKSWAMDIEIAAKKEGIEIGIEKGTEKGIERGIENSLRDRTQRNMRKGNTLDEAMEILELTENEKNFVQSKLKKSDEYS